MHPTLRPAMSPNLCSIITSRAVHVKLKITRAVIWAAHIEDRPGGLAEKLEALAQAGANLDFILARRAPESPGMGVVFVAPLKGERQLKIGRAHV